MDLFRRNVTEAQQRELDALRSQINVARATLLARIDSDMSQEDLAKRAGTTQARVSEIEAMKGDPKLSTLGRIALALGYMIDMVPIPASNNVSPTISGFAHQIVVGAGSFVAAGSLPNRYDVNFLSTA